MEFELGVFQSFRISGSAGLHLGQYELTLPENAVVEFDGTVLKYAGTDYAVPALKGGVNAGWLVPVADNISNYIPRPAGVRVKAAQSHGTEREDVAVGIAAEEAKVVGDVEAQKQRRLSAAETPMTSSGQMKPVTAQAGNTEMKPVTATFSEGSSSIANVGDGEVVARVGMPRPKYPVELEPAAGAVVRTVKTAAEEPKEAPASAVGVPVGNYKFGNPQTSVNMADSGDVAAAKNKLRGASDQLGRPAPAERMATAADIPKTLEEGKATLVTLEDAKPVPMGTAGSELETLLPDAVSSGKPEPTAQMGVTADNFEWDTKVQWRRRVSQAVGHAANPDVMAKIMASESDTVKKHIKAELTKRNLPIPS